jgi:membrane protein implicated in regulation of membrane protease activity
MISTSRTERGSFRLTRNHLLWICPIIGLMAGAVIFWLFGIGLWTMIAFLFLITCPLVVAWVLVTERQENRASRKQP